MRLPLTAVAGVSWLMMCQGTLARIEQASRALADKWWSAADNRRCKKPANLLVPAASQLISARASEHPVTSSDTFFDPNCYQYRDHTLFSGSLIGYIIPLPSEVVLCSQSEYKRMWEVVKGPICSDKPHCVGSYKFNGSETWPMKKRPRKIWLE